MRGLLLVVLLAGCPKAPVVPTAEPGALTLLHTNDIHGHFAPERADWLPGEPAIGGFVRLEQELRAVRAARAPGTVLTFDGGDQLTGTPLTDLDEEGSVGGAMHRFFDRLGYDAWAVGNHEFDKGLDNLRGYTGRAAALPLSVNVRAPDGGPLLPRQAFSHVFERGGVRVGVIGVTTDSLAGLMSPRDFARLSLLEEVAAVRAEAERLDPDTDLLVVVSHIGLDADRAIARAVPALDVIVGGHSHTRLTAPVQEGNTWIVQAGSYNRSLGVVDLVVADDAVRSFRYELRDLTPESAAVPPDPALQALVDTYAARIDAYYGEVVSEAPVTLTRDYHHDNPLGRFITDALRSATGAEVAFYNGGGLRADLVAGVVTRGALYACFPFGNQVMTYRLTGSELLQVVLRNLAAEADEQRGYLSVSGLTWTWRVRNGAPEVVEVRVGEQPLQLDRLYTVTSSSYVAEQWERHLGAAPRDPVGTEWSDLDAAVAWARRGPVRDDGVSRGVRLE